MYRTPEEEAEYQALSREERKRYDLEASLDPTMTHSQIMKCVGFDEIRKNTIKLGGQDVNLKNPGVQKSILEQVGDFLRTKAPSVWRNVKDAFSQAISYLANLISRGIEWLEVKVIDPVIDFLDDLFG